MNLTDACPCSVQYSTVQYWQRGDPPFLLIRCLALKFGLTCLFLPKATARGGSFGFIDDHMI